jgi:hypothetical protein
MLHPFVGAAEAGRAVLTARKNTRLMERCGMALFQQVKQES